MNREQNIQTKRPLPKPAHIAPVASHGDTDMTREFKIRLTFNDNGPADVLYICAKSSREASERAIAKYVIRWAPYKH